MKAIVRRRYGPPAVVRLEDVDRPVPGDGEVLVRVRAASANPLDWHFMRGTPRLLRLGLGRPRPRKPGLGADLAGEVRRFCILGVERGATGYAAELFTRCGVPCQHEQPLIVGSIKVKWRLPLVDRAIVAIMAIER